MRLRVLPCFVAGTVLGGFPAHGAEEQVAPDHPGQDHTALAPPLRAALDAAIASGNDADIDTVAKYLKKAAPENAAEIDGIVAHRRAQVASVKEDKLRNERFFQGWKGEGQIGASQSSGNTDTVGVTVGLKLKKEGLHWRHNFNALVDYERSSGVTDRNQLQFGLESDYKFSDRVFVFGSALYERNRFSGYNSRVSLSGGIGYRVIAAHDFSVDLKLAPAWRRTDYLDEPKANEVTGLAQLNSLWKISKTLSFNEDATMLSGNTNTSLTSLSALTLKINSTISVRAAYQLTYNSQPTDAYRTTDTLTRFTLVYGF